jgi:hypothetical protein
MHGAARESCRFQAVAFLHSLRGVGIDQHHAMKHFFRVGEIKAMLS